MRAFVTALLAAAATPTAAFRVAPAGRGQARRGPTQRAFRARTSIRTNPLWVREAQRVPYTQDDGRVDERGIYEGRAFDTSERDGCGVGFIAQPENAGEANHDVMQKALNALGCMEHRGACSSDGVSGDGAGVLTDIPWGLLEEEIPEVKDARSNGRPIAMGMVFFSKDTEERADGKKLAEQMAEIAGLKVVAWREVPVDESILGEASAATVPFIEQMFVEGPGLDSVMFKRAAYIFRRQIRGAADLKGLGPDSLYICSLGEKTVTYKGMVNSYSLGTFYKDLVDPRFKCRFAIYHRRFSTNTTPKWPLAQPMRMLGHNGEINTLLGNVNWMRARSAAQDSCDISKLLDPDTEDPLQNCDTSFIEGMGSLVDTTRSDSANMDSIFELYSKSGRPMAEALRFMVPEAYENGRVGADPTSPDYEMEKDVVGFYDFHAPLQEAWDGPALICFSDGDILGATLDRNGLRPARYTRLKDGTVYLMSETGVVPLDDGDVVEKGRLGPGQMINVDLKTGEFKSNQDIRKMIAKSQPWRELVENTQFALKFDSFGDRYNVIESDEEATRSTTVIRNQVAFGWGVEDLTMMVSAMASTGGEATFSMGDDAPLAVLSDRPHVLYDYFRQRFAQVTNPPIDPLREGEVMSLKMFLGPRGHVLNDVDDASTTRLVSIPSPVLNGPELTQLKSKFGADGVSPATAETISTRFDSSAGGGGLEAAVKALANKVCERVRDGVGLVVLSDLAPLDGSDAMADIAAGTTRGLGPNEAYIPPLAAVGAVHHALIEQGLRMRCSLVVETGQCWTTHHVACLVGYGASAVHPWLAFDAVREWLNLKGTKMAISKGTLPADLDDEKALANFRNAMDKGVLKILSKMGISLLSTYQGAQIFEALGIGGELLDLSFKGTPTRVGGLNTEELGNELFTFLDRAYPKPPEGEEESVAPKKLNEDGFVKVSNKLEHHSNSPQLAKQLHKSIRHKDSDMYKEWSNSLRNRPITALRDLLEIGPDGSRPPVPLDEVESVDEIMKRFVTGGMSLGALSRECHETIALAVNRIGGKSNSGEGGEDKVRDKPLPKGDTDADGVSKTLPHLKLGGLKDGDSASSKIKQIASGRFGVTPAYLATADQLEIKVAQGAKPGEGGQLPGPKVSGYIAEVRGAVEGVTLISPPPHHDIYSIEDLAQLIYDLKAINPEARVSVKLVGSPGIGTVAAGVAKANADVVQVSGHDGGTGASPLSSIKHAGSPWELGAAEVHRTLVENNLRDSVLMRVDGGIRTGYDVIAGALLGGEEFGFGTVAMVAAGCVMARVCHLNTCPVGVTTQRPELRAKFPGVAEHVVNYFAFVAEEVREIMAELGYRSLGEVVGKGNVNLLPRSDGRVPKKTSGMTTAFLTDLPESDWVAPGPVNSGLGSPVRTNGPMWDDEILAMPDVAKVIETGEGTVTVTESVVNVNRAAVTRVSGAVARKWSDAGLPDGAKVNFELTGSAGQSFCAFNSHGLDVKLTGEANDYVCKGIHGGKVVIVPPPLTGTTSGQEFDSSLNSIIGNTALYGATGGKLFAAGRAGERFAVRNSGATTVVEGAGEHCCEYMTNGVVVVLGPTGRNIGAAMTGGVSYFLEGADVESLSEDERLAAMQRRLNPGTVRAKRITATIGKQFLKDLIQEHYDNTGSTQAEGLLADWDAALGRFWQVVPPSMEGDENVADDDVTAANRAAAAAAAAAAASSNSTAAVTV